MKITNDVKKNDEYQKLYFENGGMPIPCLSDSLELQAKMEQLIFFSFASGYKSADRKNKIQISQLKYRNKIQKERIKGLEAMLNG